MYLRKRGARVYLTVRHSDGTECSLGPFDQSRIAEIHSKLLQTYSEALRKVLEELATRLSEMDRVTSGVSGAQGNL